MTARLPSKSLILRSKVQSARSWTLLVTDSKMQTISLRLNLVAWCSMASSLTPAPRVPDNSSIGGISLSPAHLTGRAVLVNFGWDRYWGTETYRAHPFVSREVVSRLCDAGITLFGVDCSNVDSTADAERPAHTGFLRQGVLIVENLTGLARLHGKRFRFFSIPLKARDAAAFPIRAFAEVRE